MHSLNLCGVLAQTGFHFFLDMFVDDLELDWSKRN